MKADRIFAQAVDAEAAGDHVGAREAAETALAIDGHHAGAIALLGLCQIRDGQRRSGRASQDRATAHAPHDPDVLHFVGVGSWECEDGERAIEVLTEAIEADSSHARSAAVLAQILELSNRVDEAQTVLDRFEVTDPASMLLRARLRRRGGAYDEAIGILDRIDPTADGADPRLIHAERSRCLDLSGQTEEAWEQTTLANQLAVRNSTHSGIGPWFDRLATFHRQSASHRPNTRPVATPHRPGGSGLASDDPSDGGSWPGPRAFVLGFPRSGTTLIESLLTTGHHVTSTREVEAIALAVAQVCEATGRGYVQLLGHPKPSDPHAIRSAYARVLDDQLIDTSGIVIDKLPLNVLYLGAIELAFPDSALIVARRHPADAVLSAYFEQFADNPGMAQLNSLDGAARLYNSVIGLWETVREVTAMACLEVHYERLVTSPETETVRISEFLGLELDPTALLGTRSTSVRINTPSYTEASGPAHQRSVGRWRRYRRQLAPVLGTLGVTP